MDDPLPCGSSMLRDRGHTGHSTNSRLSVCYSASVWRRRVTTHTSRAGLETSIPTTSSFKSDTSNYANCTCRVSNTLSLSFLQAKKAKQAEIDRKRAEVRKRMEEASKAKKAKKGFMTPDRKKKLRVSYSPGSTLLFTSGPLA